MITAQSRISDSLQRNQRGVSRILRLLLCLTAVAYTSRMMEGQALPTAYGPGSNVTVGGGFSWFQQDYGKQHVGGGLIYSDMSPYWRYGVETEVRWLKIHSSEEVTETNYLIGPRMILSPRRNGFEPYVKLLVGVGQITLPFHYAHGSYFAYAPGAGIDYELGDYVKVRVIDFEYQHWPDFNFNSLHPYGFSTGISFRLNPMRRMPH